MKKQGIVLSVLAAASAGAAYGLYRKSKSAASDRIIVDDIPDKKGADLRIMSFNLRYNDDKSGSVKSRSKLVSAIIRQYSPDSFGVQEGTGKWMKILEKLLSDKYAFVATPRDNQGYKSERNAVFYLKDKYNLIDSGTIWLSETPEVPNTKSFGSSCHRIATWAVLENKANGEKYTHINTHLDHKSENARVEQSGILLGKITELSKAAKVVCTGDFNADNSSEVYRKMTAATDDTRAVATDSDSGMTFHNYGKFDEYFDGAIDYIFVPKDTRVYTHKIIRSTHKGMYASDHFPIVADMDLNK